MTLLVGTAQSSYYEQAASANLHIPMGSSVNVGQAYEHKRFKPPSLAGHVCHDELIEEVDAPASKDFVASVHGKFPKRALHQPGGRELLSRRLSLQGDGREGEGRRSATIMRKVIAQGDVCIDAPEGKVCIDPKSHHMSHTIYLTNVKADHSISFPKVWDDIKPYWLGQVGCDLTKKIPITPVHAEQSAAQEADRSARTPPAV